MGEWNFGSRNFHVGNENTKRGSTLRGPPESHARLAETHFVRVIGESEIRKSEIASPNIKSASPSDGRYTVSELPARPSRNTASKTASFDSVLNCRKNLLFTAFSPDENRKNYVNRFLPTSI